jgi:hypothetical protein
MNLFTLKNLKILFLILLPAEIFIIIFISSAYLFVFVGLTLLTYVAFIWKKLKASKNVIPIVVLTLAGLLSFSIGISLLIF